MTTIIHDKISTIKGLEKEFQSVIDIVTQQNDDYFQQPLVPGKWSAAQHLDHLIRSTTPLNQALRMPKITLRTMFGKCKRTERSFEEVIQYYQQMLTEGAKAVGRYVPNDKPNYAKEDSINKFRNEKNRLVEIVEKWKEERLSSHLLPHPLLGKLTVREMLFFTIHHTRHHAEIIRKSF